MTEPNRDFTPYNVDYAALFEVPVAVVDEAIQEALEEAVLEDGWSGIPDMNPLIWNRIGLDVESRIDNYRTIQAA